MSVYRMIPDPTSKPAGKAGPSTHTAPVAALNEQWKKFADAFGTVTGAKFFSQGLSFAEAERRFNATLGWKRRLDAMGSWLTLQDLESVLGLGHGLFSQWSRGQLPKQHDVGNCRRWAKSEVEQWILGGCKWGGAGMAQPTLLQAVERERQLARR